MQVIGITITLLVKQVTMILIRKVVFVGLFRKDPAASNLTMLVLESWSLGLTVWTVMVRLIKLIVVSAFYCGRIDTPLFARGVGEIGPIAIDTYPIQFRKDLVVHDAHRHPYMERLGVIYALKLRYGDDFARPAGSAWRLVVVLALMPWLRRYRVEETSENEAMEEEASKAASDSSTELDCLPDLQEDGPALLAEIQALRKRTIELELQNAVLQGKLDSERNRTLIEL